MKTQRVGYIRVSSEDQNTDRQLEGVEIDKLFTDKASGKNADRPALKAALEHAREGDTFVVHSMDRLARNVEDMLRLVRELREKGVTVEFVKERLIFDTGHCPRSTLMMMMLSAFSQFEREIIRERQKEGIRLAKARGVYKGRKSALDAHGIKLLREQVRGGESSKAQIARNFGISRDTLYKYTKEGE